MKKIVVIGSSGHARVVVDVVENEGRLEIVGLLDRFRGVGEEALGYPILGREEDLPRLIELYRSGKLALDKLITKRYALGDLPLAFADMEAGKVARGVLVFGEAGS